MIHSIKHSGLKALKRQDYLSLQLIKDHQKCLKVQFLCCDVILKPD